MDNPEQINKERKIGDHFIRWYNSTNNTNYVLESLEERQKREAPDLIFKDGGKKLEIEITGGYDSTDVNSDIGMKKTGVGLGTSIESSEIDYIKQRIKDKINCGCKNLLIDCFSSDTPWHYGMELDSDKIMDLKQDGFSRDYFENIWLIANKIKEEPVVFELKIKK